MENAPELPAKIDVERAVLGQILLDPDRFYDVSAELKPDDFHLDSHRRVLRAMIEMVACKKPLDLVSLSSHLEDRKELGNIGGVAYISSLLDGVPERLDGIDNHLSELREVSRRRQVIRLCNAAKAQAEDLSEPVPWILSGLYEDVLRVQGDSRRQRGQFVREFSGDLLGTIHEEMHSDREVLGMRLGLTTLNDATTGLRSGEVLVIGGFPGSGKTALALTILVDNASRDIPVCIFSREMTKEQLLLRIWSMVSEISYAKLRNPKNLSSSEYREIKEKWAPMVASWPLLIDDEVVMIDEMISRAQLYRRKNAIELFEVDYLQIIGSTQFPKEYERVSEATDKWTQFSKETKIPCVLLSQLTRPEKRDKGLNAEPNMMMLRSSGKIEQNAHLIFLTFHPVEDGKPTGEDVVIIGKQRAGHMGREKAYFNVGIQKWEERGVPQSTPEQTALPV